MGLLDPVYAAGQSVIAGGGTIVGETLGGLGNGVSNAGRNLGETVTKYANGWGDYAKDSANYVKDATGAHSSRGGTASNPLGLSRSQSASLQYGMDKAPTYSRPQDTLPASKKPTSGVAVGAKKTIGGAPAGAKKQLPSSTPNRALSATKSPPSPATRGKGVTRGGTSTARGTKKPTAPPKPTAQAPKSAATRGTASAARGKVGGVTRRSAIKE